MEIEGKIIFDLPMQSGTSRAGNEWKKKEWVLETFGQYPRKVKFDFFGDRADQNRLELGKCYRISYDIESREFNGRWYTDIRAFASQPIEDPTGAMPPAENAFGAAPAAPAAGYQAPQAPGFISGRAEDSGDDLPF